MIIQWLRLLLYTTLPLHYFDESLVLDNVTILYDAIVIGNDLSSLIAAEVTSSHGLKTLLLKEGKQPDFYSQSGYTFNIDPSPWSSIGPGYFAINQYLEKDFFQLNQGFLRPLNPGLQVILPDHRVDIYRERERLVREFEREFPDSATLISEIYETAWKMGASFSCYALKKPSVQLGNVLKFSSYIRELTSFFKKNYIFSKKIRCLKNTTLLRLLETQAFLFAGSQHRIGSIFSMIPYFLCLPLHGICYPLGGKHLFLLSIKNRFLSQGGILAQASELKKVEITTDKYNVEWETEFDSNKASGKHLIISAKWRGIPLLQDKRFSKVTKRLKSCYDNALFPFTLHIGIMDKGIPEKMAEYVVVIEDENMSNIQNDIFLEISSRDDFGRAPCGKRALSATRFLDASPSSLSNEFLHGVASDMLLRLEQLFPFVSENIEFMDVEQCISLSRICEDVVNRKYRIVSNPFTGISIKSNLENVFFAGDENLGLGFVGEVISGVNAGNQVIGGHRK
jgi:phytoene dehydrogenase-like protein